MLVMTCVVINHRETPTTGLAHDESSTDDVYTKGSDCMKTVNHDMLKYACCTTTRTSAMTRHVYC